jgi:hypothetical protein
MDIPWDPNPQAAAADWGPAPRYESTLGPAADSYSPSLDSWGWWSPFYYDSWSFVQSSVDQPERTEYLSGTAIRYLDGH